MDILSGDIIRLISTKYLDISSALSFRLVSKQISSAMSKVFVNNLKKNFFQNLNRRRSGDNIMLAECNCEYTCIKKLCKGCGASLCKKNVSLHKHFCTGCKLVCCNTPVIIMNHKFVCNYTSRRYFVEQHKSKDDHCLVCSKCSFKINMVPKRVNGKKKWRAPVKTSINICGSTSPQNVRYIYYDLTSNYQKLLLKEK